VRTSRRIKKNIEKGQEDDVEERERGREEEYLQEEKGKR
jgi:hypothetical protein